MFDSRFKSVFALALILSTLPVAAQQKAPPKPDAKLEDAQITIHGIQGNLLQVEYEGKPWILQIDPKAKVEISGEAELDFINVARGPLLARVRTEVNTRQKAATMPVTEIELVMLSETNVPGAQANALGGGFADAPKGNQAVQALVITGPVSGYKNGVAIIGGIKIPIDPAAKVKVELETPAALLAIPPGTTITANFSYYSQLPPGRGLLTSVKTVLATPLALPKKPTPGAKNATPKAEKTEKPALSAE